MSRAAGGGQSWVVGKLAFCAESAGVHAMPLLGPPWHTLLKHTGQGWMPGTSEAMSPVRKISELSGRLRLEAPLEQSAEPLALAVTELMTHTLVGVLPGFGIGSGGPNRHPTLVQVRVLAPGSLDLTLVRVSVVPLQADTAVSELPMSGTAYGSGTLLLPPPVKRPPQARFLVTVPKLFCTVPQLPAPMPVVKFSSLGFGLKPQQPARVVVVVVVTIVVVVVTTGAEVVVVATGAEVVVVATGAEVVVVATGAVVVVVATGAVVVVVAAGAGGVVVA